MPRFPSEISPGARLQTLVQYGISTPDEHGPVASSLKKSAANTASEASPQQLRLEFAPASRSGVESPSPATRTEHASPDTERSVQEPAFEELFTAADHRKLDQKLSSFTTLFSQGRILIPQHNWEYGFVGHDDTDLAQLTFTLLENPSDKTGRIVTIAGRLAEEAIELLAQQPERDHMDGAPEVVPTPHRKAVLATTLEALAEEKDAPQSASQATEFAPPPRNPEHDASVAEFRQQVADGRVIAVSQRNGEEFTYLLAPRNWRNYQETVKDILIGGRPAVRFEYKTNSGGTYFSETKTVTGPLADRFAIVWNKRHSLARSSP